MFLKKFIFVNWGNIPNLEFDFGPINLFSGGNGSGKTTAADALQTIMTAAHENLFQYNPGQDETTQRGRGGKRVRTLGSYVLGCDDGSYARLDATDGYLAAVFHPTQGESAEPFTALIGVRAWLDKTASQNVARQDELLFFVLPGEQLSLNQLVQGQQNNRHVMPLDKLQTALIKEYGKTRVEKYDTKKAYLRRLYAVLRGRNDAVTEREAMAAAKAFSRFMAYKPVQGINKFVAEEILEKKDLGDAIRSISGQLKTIHAMERDAGRLVDSIAILEKASDYSQQYIERWIDLNTLDYSLAQHHYQQRQREYLHAKQQQTEHRQALTQNESETELARERRQQIHQQLVQLEAQRMGISALQQKDDLERQRDEHQQQLVTKAKLLLEQDNLLNHSIELSRSIHGDLQDPELIAELPAATDLNSRGLCKQVIEQGGRGDIDFHALLNRDITGDLAALEDHLDHARTAQRLHNQWVQHWHGADSEDKERSLRGQLARLSHQRENRYEHLANQRQQKLHEIERLQAQQVSYPAHVDRALNAIRQQCPQADPRVLCDHIEVKDERWQAAIEGYLGGARFSIIVTPEHEAQAIRIVRQLPGRDNKARIIQGEKARQDAERLSLPAESIVHVLDFSHATARDYLMASYGTVVRVESAEQLRHTRRGITDDGMGSGNYSMWRCDIPDSELVFGVAARERALKAKQAELDTLVAEWQRSNDRMQLSKRLLHAVDGLQLLQYADTITGMLSTHRELQKLENLLAQLDLSEHEQLEEKLTQLREQEQHWRGTEDSLNQAHGKLQQQLEDINKRCKQLSDLQEETLQAVELCETNLRNIAAQWPEFDCDARLQQAELDGRDLDQQTAENYRKELRKQLSDSERKMDEELRAHNQASQPVDVIVYHSFDGEYDADLFATICALQRDIDRVYNRLKNNILVEKRQQLTQLKDSFNNAFVTNLCHSIYQAINDGKRQIEQLNKELQHHRFGADRETFRFDSDWIPEFRDYARFFEEVIKSPTLGDEVTLFEAPLSDKSAKVRDTIMSMLLADDEQKALRELERIADYRNYRRYEIYKEVEGKPPIALSEYGTGSGGQLETPAYIIRSAAITSAFRFAEGTNHLRMVLVDEAFSKMDETRSREVISYLTQALGLQLIFIMPTSKCGPFMDLISNEFVFAKVPSAAARGELHTRVLVDRKQCNQERIKDLWANHRRTVYQQAELDFMQEVLA
ncbi:MAG: hypothetical protein LJE85_06490 [Gammaproteobacteria bacterium]|nr:hypothetical protein [Gammaproteobacteria bacterium]